MLGVQGPRLDYVRAELLAIGDISFTSDPQLGKAVLTAATWEEMCDRAVEYFSLRKPSVLGSSSTYAEVMRNLFSLPAFRDGKIASNETFTGLQIRGSKFQSLNSDFRELELTNLLGLGCIEAKICK